MNLGREIVELNVGGQFYTSYLETLCQYHDSLFCQIFSRGNPIDRDSDGRVFFDRDGQSFRFILNFLRTGVLNLPDSKHDKEQLKLEAKYYRIKPLIEKLDSHVEIHNGELDLVQTDSVCNDHTRKIVHAGKQLTIVWEKDHPDPRDAGYVKITGKVGNLFERPSPLSLEIPIKETIDSYVNDVAVYDTVNEAYLSNPEMLFNFLQDSGYTKYNGGEFGSDYFTKHEGLMRMLGKQWKFLKL